MAPSTKTLTELKLLDPGEASPGHTITTHLKGRQQLPGEYSPVMPTPDSSGHYRPGETKPSPQNWRLRPMTDTLKIKQLRVNLEPFQTLEREIIRARKSGGISPPGSTNVTMPQNRVFLKSDNYSSTKNKDSSGRDSSKHSRARALPASDSSSKRRSALYLHE